MSVPWINEDNGDAGDIGEEKALLETDETVEPPPGIQQLLLLNEKLKQDQAPVGELADIMRLNVEKILQRYPNYSELDRRADDLNESQQEDVKNQEQCLMKFIKVGAIISILLLIIIAIVVLGRHFDFMFSNSNTTYQGAGRIPQLDGPRYSDKIHDGWMMEEDKYSNIHCSIDNL